MKSKPLKTQLLLVINYAFFNTPKINAHTQVKKLQKDIKKMEYVDPLACWFHDSNKLMYS